MNVYGTHCAPHCALFSLRVKTVQHAHRRAARVASERGMVQIGNVGLCSASTAVVESITERDEHNKSPLHEEYRLVSVAVGGPLKCGMSPHDHIRIKPPLKSRWYGDIA